MKVPSWRNLRFRIDAAFGALGLILSALFALATFISFEIIRPWYFDERVVRQLDDFVARQRADGKPGSWSTADYTAYVAPLDDLERLPIYLQTLGSGRYQIEHDDTMSEIFVEEDGDFRYLLVYDISQIEAVEEEITAWIVVFLLSGVIVSGLLALWIGHRLSSRIIRPVTRLARQVKQLEVDGSLDLRLDAYGTDEVAELGQAFERYLRRLRTYIENEKAFSADASHELRTGVASVASTVELLLTDEHSAPTRARLQRLERASRHMKRVIEALLVLSRAEAAAPGHDDEEVDRVETVLEEIVDSRRAAARAGGVTLTIDGDTDGDVETDGASTARASVEGLTVVIGNLIDNAIAYAPEGLVRIRLDGDVIEIADDGPGIPEHELPYVYQRSFRGDRSTGPGAGLGLAIVKRLCEHHGWAIDLESQTGAGTTVRVDLAPA